MPTSADVVIIGGGILGTSLAYYLAQKGAGDVVLLERASIADGSTGKSAAIVRMHCDGDWSYGKSRLVSIDPHS